MKKLNVIEINKRVKRIQQVGEKLGFTVDEDDDFLIWKSSIYGEYKLIPYFYENEIENREIEDSIVVCISDEFSFADRYKGFSLEELEKLINIIGDNSELKEKTLNYWKMIYGSFNFRELLSLIDREKEDSIEKKSGKKTAVKESGPNNDKHVDNSYDFGNVINVEIKEKLFLNENRSKTIYINRDNSLCVARFEANPHPEGKRIMEYWYSVYRRHIEAVNKRNKGYYAFCLKADKKVLLIESTEFNSLLSRLSTSPNKGDPYWHIKIHCIENKYWFLTKDGKTELGYKRSGMYLIPEESKENKSQNNDVDESEIIHVNRGAINREVRFKQK